MCRKQLKCSILAAPGTFLTVNEATCLTPAVPPGVSTAGGPCRTRLPSSC